MSTGWKKVLQLSKGCWGTEQVEVSCRNWYFLWTPFTLKETKQEKNENLGCSRKDEWNESTIIREECLAWILLFNRALGGQGLCVKGVKCVSLVGLSPLWNLSRLQMSCLFCGVLLTGPLANWLNTVVDVTQGGWWWWGVTTRVVSESHVSASQCNTLFVVCTCL